MSNQDILPKAPPNQPLRDVPVDWEALEDAFENNAPEVHSYLHLQTGDVLRVVDGVADPQMHARINGDNNYLRIAPVSSREQYRWMERYIPMVEEPELRAKLAASIDGKGAFRRFKDVLMSHSAERERWFTFRSERLRTFMEAWLVAHALQPVPRPTWATNGEEAAPPPPEEVPPVENREPRRSRNPENQRKHIRDLIETLGPRDLEILASFGEFLKARRIARAYAHHLDSHQLDGASDENPPISSELDAVVSPPEPTPSPRVKLTGSEGNSLAVRWSCWLLALVLFTISRPASSRGETIDRVIYIFDAPETGGAGSPRIIFERELAFEARLESLSSGEPLLDASGLYAARHLRAALDRHIATDLLAHLPVEGNSELRLPAHPCDLAHRPTGGDDIENRIQLAWAVLALRVRGSGNLRSAIEAEGLNDYEIRRILRREALAARYLDRMIAPMLAPADSELRELLRSSGNPFHGKSFDESRCDLRRWVIGQRLATALGSFLQSSRTRVRLRRVP